MVNTKIKLYAVRDLKSKMYDIPFFAHSDLFAERRFRIDVTGERSKDSMIGTFPEDFELHALGEFETTSGKFETKIKTLVKGSEVKKNA